MTKLVGDTLIKTYHLATCHCGSVELELHHTKWNR